jgi:hypothetical protein
MTAELIYKTTSPKALAWYRDVLAQNKEQAAARAEYTDHMTAEFGKPDLPDYFSEERRSKRSLWLRGDRAFAIDSGHNERPPVDSGWRLDSKDHNWQPKLATKAGKERAAELAALSTFDTRSHLPEIGVPQMAFADSHLYQPGLEFDEAEGVLYIAWGSGRCAAEALAAQAKVPEIEWAEVKRSEWYAREEAKAEREAVDA